MIRILLVDDQALIRRALRTLLTDEPGLVVVGEEENGQAALDAVAVLMPDIVLMDIQMPVLNGIEATRLISRQFPTVKVLILSVDDDYQCVAPALRNGAAGYLLKETPPEELALAIEAVYRGFHVCRGIWQELISHIPEPTPKDLPSLKDLTPREQEILGLISQGATNQEIADRLHISLKTVKNHVTSILSRLNLRDRTQAAIFANTGRKVSATE
ncbi:MAG: response regulator transcription factor [Cyanobacteria bacterium P01_H01_bin.15]